MRERVFAYLPDELARRLQRVAPAAVCVDSWAHVTEAVRKGRASIVVADPAMDGGAAASAVIDLAAQYASAQFIAFTRLRPETIGYALRLAAAGITDVVLYGHDDHAARFEDLFDHAAARDAVRVLLAELWPLLEGVPSPLLEAVREMYWNPLRFRSAADLALAAHMTPRALYRHLTGTRVESARRLVASARAFRAFVLLQDSGRTISDVARRLGYADGDRLTEALRDLTGLGGRDLRGRMTAREFAHRVVMRLTTTAAGTATAADVVALAI